MNAIAGANPLTLPQQSVVPAADDFAGFIARNAQFAYRIAYARLRHAGDAEDTVQECFLKLLKAERWRAANDERAFIARTVWRLASDLRKRYPVQPEPGSGRPIEPVSVALTPEQQAIQAADHAQIHTLVDTLPEKLRFPLVLSAFEDLGSREIAAVLEIPEGTVRRQLSEARKLLKGKLIAMERRHAQ